MNPFRNPVRPHWTPPPGAMSCQEIQFWMQELRRRGWNRGCTARALGMSHHNWCKAYGREWIYPREQLRFSRQLRKIISGEVVMKVRLKKDGKPHRNGGSGRGRGYVQDPVLADTPEPLHMPMKLTFDMKAGRLRMQPLREIPENPLPSFKSILQKQLPQMAGVKHGRP